MDITFMGAFAPYFTLALFAGCYLGLSLRRKSSPNFKWVLNSAGFTRLVALSNIVLGVLAIVGGVVQRMTNRVLGVTAKFYQTMPTGSPKNTARVLSGNMSQGYVLAEGLSFQARIYLSIEFAANLTLWMAVAAIVYQLATSVVDRRGFLGSLPTGLKALAILIVITQTLSQYFGSLADSTVGKELFGANEFLADVPHAFGGMNLPLWQLFAAAAIWMLAHVFQSAARLQKDNSGLI